MSRYKCNEEMHNVCTNNVLCHLCDGKALFKDPLGEKKEKLRIREENKEAMKKAPLKIHQKEKKEGMAFEKRVASQWNKKFGGDNRKAVAKPRLDMLVDESRTETAGQEEIVHQASSTPIFPARTSTPKRKPVEARRQPNSGAMWHSKGDIKLDHALMECKERGTVNSRGQKQITIPKAWIEKQEKEAFQENRPYWYIPFGYKGDDGIYLVKSYDHEMEMIFELRRLREELERLQEKL